MYEKRKKAGGPHKKSADESSFTSKKTIATSAQAPYVELTVHCSETDISVKAKAHFKNL
ncbi:MAG TPA: hypothetical protein PKE04_11505 [Clostridia bacterium]|nr:hypothetical protein [Clostridia bacterium]